MFTPSSHNASREINRGLFIACYAICSIDVLQGSNGFTKYLDKQHPRVKFKLNNLFGRDISNAAYTIDCISRIQLES